jgi:hypothetical protein
MAASSTWALSAKNSTEELGAAAFMAFFLKASKEGGAAASLPYAGMTRIRFQGCISLRLVGDP